ncbi:MAG: hypothetical protein Q8M18_03890 [Bradyrhizobium sp.]|nr:hypothetical protein [Bradyrhizobium sp.]
MAQQSEESSTLFFTQLYVYDEVPDPRRFLKMNFRLGVLLFLMLGSTHAVAADMCDPLKPNPARNISQEIKGKIDAKVDGFAKRLIMIGGNIDGTVRDVSNDVLKDYPNADKLYVWDRVLYIFCIQISGSRLSDSEKFDELRKLIGLVGKPVTMRPCAPGQIVRALGDTFHLRVLAVNDGEMIQSIMRKVRESGSGNYGQDILKAVKAGNVQRMSGTAGLQIRIRGISTDQVPSHVPYLVAKDVCQRMVSAERMADGVVILSIAITGDQHLAEAAVVLPRRIFETSPTAQVCIEPSFPLANATEARQNMYCDIPGRTGLYETVLKGGSQRTYILTRRTSYLLRTTTQKVTSSTSNESGAGIESAVAWTAPARTESRCVAVS